jgi:RNA 2',3'-cyclic 3'-phosphodiesterase
MRLFVALDLPDDIRTQISAMQYGIPGAHWSLPENAHITLCFIGDRSEADMVDIGMALSRISAPAFDLQLEGLGVFGNHKRPRILWAAVKTNPALDHLQQKIVMALNKCAIPPEERRFKPHVTLARIHNAPYERVRSYLSDYGLFKSRTVSASDFTLFSSCLGHGGPHYEEEFIFDLETQLTPQDDL